jgi:catechol 2,3-dioxygenase-like lactoylglutathione lyase family enzyme
MNPASSLRRPGAVGVHSVDRFVFTVPDLAEAERFYRAFGLDVKRTGERLDLHTFGHSHCWSSVFEGPGPKQLAYVRYGVDEADLPAFRQRVAQRGIGCDVPELAKRRGDVGGIWLRNPDGTPLQLAAAPKVSPSAKTQRRPAEAVAPGRGAAPARSAVRTVQPRALSHVLFFSADVPRMVAFNADVLGLRLSDHSDDIVAFMHGAHGSDHHLIALAKSHAPGLHHSSWEVNSLDDVGSGAEQMRSAGFARGWGLGRHVLGSNYFHYVRDPWGSFAEYSFDIDFVPHDLDWPAANHPVHDSLYVWGPAVPEDFIVNHEWPLPA